MCLVAMAASETNDLAYLAAVTKLDPLFVVAVQWNLSVNETWLGQEGRSELARLLSSAFGPNSHFGAASVDELLEFLLEYIYNHRSRDLIDLEGN